jgi:DNA helicase-2/ATP-dependent DNA helicase PcrA
VLDVADFVGVVQSAIPRFRTRPPNQRQQDCILWPVDRPLMIAAGPGSGKTTVLVLRALRLVFCSGLLPEEVLITTFTRKAAQELRTRLIEWGLRIKEHLGQHPHAPQPAGWAPWLDTIDINRFVTGTLDSLCEDVLTTHRDPADAAPVLVEGFVGNALLAREGLFPAHAHTSADLRTYLTAFTREGDPPQNFGEVLDIARTLVDRLIFDRVDVTAYGRAASHTAARGSIVAALHNYRTAMTASNRMDFARLEELFFERLAQGRLARFATTVRAILVDEYQDTNPLQESIYFELVRQTSASITVVGDDDQSLYRFRGATVELYRDFQSRFARLVPGSAAPELKYLVDNYRSTPEIVQFFNAFATNDPAFAPARVQPLKPPIVAQLASNGAPVLGMFRPDPDTLAADLSDFLFDVFRGNGRVVTVGGRTTRIARHAQGGDFGDAVFLGHTVNEYAFRWRNQPARARLPVLLRNHLVTRGVQVFNPRGRALRDVPVVQQLLGLILDCIDPVDGANPEGRYLTELGFPPAPATPKLRGQATTYLREWRTAARAFAASNPHPSAPHSLARFVQAWQTRTSQTTEPWPTEWPLLELCFKLISWIPFLRDDPEGQVYLEAVSRCIAQAATYSKYRSSIIRDGPIHGPNSIKAAIMDVLAPLAESDVEVDEDIMPSVPRNRLQFMTIHQAKGLEFPLVIVDVSSDYRSDHPTTRFRRFPESPSSVQGLEDDLAPFCDIGPLRVARPPLARTFDDLIRLYYVAYSRPQSVLLLTGLDKVIQYRTTVKHVACSWRADETWAWRVNVPGAGRRGNRLPALANNIPLSLV